MVLNDISRAGWRILEHTRLALQIIPSAKPDLELRDCKGRSVLRRVVRSLSEDMLEMLLQAGADVKSQDCRGRSPLHRLLDCDYPDPERVAILLKWGADLDIVDSEGMTAGALGRERSFHRNTARTKRILDLIRQNRTRKVMKQQQAAVQAPPQRSEKTAPKKKQKGNKRNRAPATNNPFSVLTMEETKGTDAYPST